ncbi:hypothetical protein L873DRAFT_1822384, partial [Choiromyces venosus 120613-1]
MRHYRDGSIFDPATWYRIFSNTRERAKVLYCSSLSALSALYTPLVLISEFGVFKVVYS